MQKMHVKCVYNAVILKVKISIKDLSLSAIGNIDISGLDWNSPKRTKKVPKKTCRDFEGQNKY